MIETTDFASIEVDKENIQPIPQGRSALKLKELVTADQDKLNATLVKERAEFESKLTPETLEELDDPLELYLQYIKWIRENYRNGNTNESCLIQVLERATHDFKDNDYYKNEIRYFKIWLEYITYSDHPGDVFNYLLKKKIGAELALFYEEYSQFFELNGQYDKAQSIFELGISVNARPSKRLKRNYDTFLERRKEKGTTVASYVAKGLSNPDGKGLLLLNSSEKPKKKMELFSGSSLQDKTIDDISAKNHQNLDKIENSRKENKLEPTKWKGQTLNVSSSKTKTTRKMEIFRDKDAQYPITKKVPHADGKRYETHDFNLDLFMPTAKSNSAIKSESFSMFEVLLKFYNIKPVSVENKSEFTKRSSSTAFETPLNKRVKNTCVDQSPNVQDTPLLEYFKSSKGIFSMMDEDKSAVTEGKDNFEKEVVGRKTTFGDIPRTEEKNELIDAIIGGAFSDIFTDNTLTKTTEKELLKTPIKESSMKTSLEKTETQNNDDLTSSPFVENPDDSGFELAKSTIVENTVVNPYDRALRKELETKIASKLFRNVNFNNFSNKTIRKLQCFKSIFQPKAPAIYGNKQALIELNNVTFCITRELGSGDLSHIYLSESLDGKLIAMKVTSPPEIWEPYIISAINLRSRDFIKIEAFNMYEDESYLLIPYYEQGSLSDMMKCLSRYNYLTGKNFIEETLIIYLSIQLLSNVIKLHKLQIVHCDLKLEKCMLNIQRSSIKPTFNDLVLTGYEKSIDLTLFPIDTKFNCESMNISGQNLSEIVDSTNWRYEPDYIGVANIIHYLLFGNTLKLRKQGPHFRLVEPLKKYWQQDLWNELFDVLINPKIHGPPESIILELERLKAKFQNWFNLTVDKRLFMNKLRDICGILETRFKTK